MKKRILTLSLVVLTIAGSTTFTSCRKGENDPFISLRTRKARLAGEWALQSGNISQVSTSGGTTTTSNYSLNGSTLTSSSGGASITVTYTQKFTIKKDNTFERVTNYDGDITTESGSWFFNKKNKSQDLKNKEAIIISIESETDNSGTTTYTGVYADELLIIDQLKNKEIIFKSENTSSSSGYTSSITSELTYTQ